MRRILSLFNSFILSLFTLCLAADILPEQALQIASDFVQHDRTAQANICKAPAGTRVSPSIAHKMPSRVAADKDNVYIVNLGDNQGFVIVSGETGTTADILGYCDHGSFDIDNAPIQFLDLINEYTAGIDSLRKDPSIARPQLPDRARLKAAGASYPSYLGEMVVEPLLTTTWNQWAPYNNLCPIAEDGTPAAEYGGRCPTGCVITAVAQVMNYWKWPKESRGQVASGWSQETGWVYEDFSGHVYDWDNMLDYYGNSSIYGKPYQPYTAEQAYAVAYLMRDLGKLMGAEYHYNGSPAGYNMHALYENMGYAPDSETESGNSPTAIMQPLKNELNEGRPVLYSGDPDQGDGHALVCDGYTSKDYFHFNYGWGGHMDGFYLLAAVPMYNRNVAICTKVRPYDAEQKIIGLYKFGLFPNGTADILDYLEGGMNVNNGAVVIPDSVTDPDTGIRYAVTHICQMAFYRKGNFSKITLGKNIDAIDRYSFVYSRIDTLVLSDKMEVVPEHAFENTNIKHLTIGANVRRIGKGAFFLCPLSLGIECKSAGFEVEREAFAHTKPATGAWSDRITRVRNQAFVGARMAAWTTFNGLEVIEDSAFHACYFGSGSNTFRIGPKVREIDPSAFDGWQESGSVPVIQVDESNPYFSSDFYPNIYNKNQTSLHICLMNPSAGWPETLVKMEPGCVRNKVGSFDIPVTIREMDGAFSECRQINKYDYVEVKCPLAVPPVIADATFNDDMFTVPDLSLYLVVPEGSGELYAAAAGWRKFGDHIIEWGDATPLPPQDLQYRMVIHGDSLKANIPIADVARIQLTEQDGEPIATMFFNGREDIQTPVSKIDSIIWKPGFVYDNAEIYELNDSTLSVQAQRCTIQFDASVIDEDVELCVRNSTLIPHVADGVIGGVGIDISLSDGTHQLTGTAQITVPMKAGINEQVCAAWFNEESGEWEPVFSYFDRNTGNLTIITSHLTNFVAYKVVKEHTKVETLEPITEEIPTMNDLRTALEALKNYVSSASPEFDRAEQIKSDMGFWQSVGLDCMYNGVIAVTEPLYNFKPDAIDNAVSRMGDLSVAINILDVVKADAKGDDIGVAAGTLKIIMSQTTGKIAAAIGTPIMAASMSIVAFIGVALEKFGTTVAEHKVDQLRAAYRLFYRKGAPWGVYRTPKDWFQFFYPTIQEGNMTEAQLRNYIETSVREYCDAYWHNTDAQSECKSEAIKMGITTLLEDNASNRQIISDEHYAELMNGTLVSVFNAVKMHAIADAHENYLKRFNDVASIVNGKLAFDIRDSSRPEGQNSKYAGWKIGFDPVPENVTDKPKWQTTIRENGTAALGWFTIYALMQNGVQCHLTLFNDRGEPVKLFDFELNDMKKETVYRIDLAGGVSYDLEPVPGLELTYDPIYVEFPYTYFMEEDVNMDGNLTQVQETSYRYFYPNDSTTYKHVRFRTEIERFLNRHRTIEVDEKKGTVRIGEDLVGVMEGDEGHGTFNLSTSYRFSEKTLAQFIKDWNNPSIPHWYRTDELLNGTLKHQIACNFTVHRNHVGDHDEYEVHFTGEGAYDLTALYVNEYKKVIDWVATIQGTPTPLKMEEVGTGTYSAGGDVKLEYKVTLKPSPISNEQ